MRDIDLGPRGETFNFASRGIARSTVQGAIGRQEKKDIYAVKQALDHSTVGVTEVYLAGLGLRRTQCIAS